MLALLLACDAPPEDSAAACESTAPAVERLDVPTGHRTIDAPVTAPWLTEERTIPVNLWYPTDATEGDAARYLDLWIDDQSWDDAPFADPDPDCALPLVIYSHGYQGWGGNASPLLRHLVAQGWVAAAPDHLGNTLVDDVTPHAATFPVDRAVDIQAALDAIAALPDDDPLAGRVDTDRVLVMGHSRGGETAALLSGPAFDAAAIDTLCAKCTEAERAAFDAPVSDPRVAAVMPLDGFAGTDLVASDGWASAAVPLLYLARSSEGDDEHFLTAAAADLTWGRFEGACHETFTDTDVPCDTYEKEDGLDDVAQYLTALAATRVLGLDEAPYTGILDGSTVVDERITVRHTRE